jgi:hypothetical protein
VIELTRSRRRRRLIAALVVLLVVGGGLSLVVPRAAHAVAGSEVFRVAEMELEGARFLTLEEAVAAAAVPEDASVWDDPADLEARLEEHPLVRSAHVRRRLPSTLVFEVEEREPVALVPAPTLLAPVDAEGNILPIDPSEHGLDLLLLRMNTRAKDASKVLPQLAAQADRLIRVDPDFVAGISEIERDARGDIIARWGDPAVTFHFTTSVTARKLREGMLVMSSVASDTGEPPAIVDLRFEEQVVVRRSR